MQRAGLLGDARHGNVSELLLGAELVKSGFFGDLGKELKLGSELLVGRSTDLNRVNDSRVHFGGIGHLRDVDMLGSCLISGRTILPQSMTYMEVEEEIDVKVFPARPVVSYLGLAQSSLEGSLLPA